MSLLNKNPDGLKPSSTTHVERLVEPLQKFNIQANSITNREETYLKIKGAFKCKVQNKGDVDVKIFGNYPLPSHSEETFETGDTNYGFSANTAIEYAAVSPEEKINIILTSYFKVQ
jgi:hypothetical protein